MRWGLMVGFGALAPWVAAANLYFNARGQWIAALGCLLVGGGMAALSLDALLRARALITEEGESELSVRAQERQHESDLKSKEDER